MSRPRHRLHFHRPRRSRAGQWLLVAAALGGLAACATATAQWSEVEAPKVVRVEPVRYAHAVPFAAGATRLTAEANAALDAFLARVGIIYGDNITVLVPAEGSEATLARARASSIIARLAAHGFAAEAVAAPPGPVTVAVARNVATPPACPDWRKPSGTDVANRTASNLGCATAANLGLMVANPRDLVQPGPLGPGDGEMLARGLKKYREGDAPKPSAITPLVIQSGAPSGGGGQ